MLLAIDTATEFAGLALYNADAVWAEEIWYAARNHTIQLAPRLHNLLQQAGLSADKLEGIAVCIGPGSYTGVRIGVALAKGLALPHNLPLVGVHTLEVVATPQHHQPLPIVAVAKAGRKRLMTGRFLPAGGQWRLDGPVAVVTFDDLLATFTGPALVTGELSAEQTARLHAEAPHPPIIVSPAQRVRRPAILAEIGWERLQQGQTDSANSLEPVYAKSP